ncbi:MAG: exo-beta-N-acetylmuramidase NamZ family protein [Fimbriimonas sp.]
MVSVGLDRLVASGFRQLRGQRVGLLCNQASIDANYSHILDHLTKKDSFRLAAVFGPQHGLFGHTQDNMIEWEPSEGARPYRLHSLYGEHREPTPTMLEGLDLFVVDIPDVGARYYTFIWSMFLCMKACVAKGIPMLVLDRPNPINGTTIEGTVLQPEFASFVGLYPLPLRHGMTVGEIARYFKTNAYPDLTLEVVQIEGWNPSHFGDESGATWAMPSPNMPTVDTAIVYPGGCLVEGTNLSEGRGTTRPFEIIGAPYLDGSLLAMKLNGLDLGGVRFRPVQFQPTFQKYAGQLCEGVALHVTNREAFAPVLTFVALFQEVRRLVGDAFEWKQPPYEYEFNTLPIDILAGNNWLRENIDNLSPLEDIQARFQAELKAFHPIREAALLYPRSHS